MLARIKFEIGGLVREIVERLPAEVFTSTETTFLDPAMAGGQFLVEIIRKLRDNGHSDDNIASRVFGLAEDRLDLNYAQRKNGVIGQLAVGGIETLENYKNMGKKFDVVIGNPPYQNGERAIYHEFYKKAHQLAQHTIALIAPISWLISNKKTMALFREDVIRNGLYHVTELDASKVFGVKVDKLGITYQCKLSNNTLQYTYVDQQGNEIVCSGIGVPVLHHSLAAVNIIDKLTSASPKLNANNTYIRGLNNNGECKTGDTVASPTSTHTYKMITRLQSGQYVYAWTRINKNPHDKMYKVAFGRLTSTKSLGDVHIIKEDGTTTSEMVVYVPASTLAEAQSLKSYLDSRIFRFVLPHKRPGTTNACGALSTISIPPLTKIWTDQELYAHFNLTQEEIDLIEATVK